MLLKTLRTTALLGLLTSQLFAGTTTSPVVHESFLFEEAPFKSCHASTLVETEKGELLAAFFAGEDEGAKDVAIWTARYKDHKWGNLAIVAQDPDGYPCWNPVLFSFPDNELVLFYKIGPHPLMWSGVLKRSTDQGKSWKEEEPLPAGILGPIKNKPLLLDNNALLCGSSIESYKRWGCYCDYSLDRGKTWNRSTPINLKDDYFGIIQPTLFELGESNLLLLARTRASHFIAKAHSSDGGKTWTTATLTELPNPNSGIDGICLKDGRLLLVYNDSKEKRTPLSVAISNDKGSTWKKVLDLEEKEGEYSYPAVIQTKEGLVVITYTWNREKIKEVTLDPSELK